MHQLEEMPILIESHRAYLRSLYGRGELPDPSPSRRERLGAHIVRFGHWVGNHCPEIASEPQSSLPDARPGLSHP